MSHQDEGIEIGQSDHSEPLASDPRARMTSQKLSQGAQSTRSPLLLASERRFPRRRLGVMNPSTPGLAPNSQALPLTGASRTVCPRPSRRPQGCQSDDTQRISLRPQSFKESQWTLATPSANCEVKMIKLKLLHLEASRLLFWSPPRCGSTGVSGL